MRTKINCCHNCPDRVADPNCHGYCETYLKQKAEYDEARKKIADQKKIDGEITGTILRGIHQRMHIKHMEKKKNRR